MSTDDDADPAANGTSSLGPAAGTPSEAMDEELLTEQVTSDAALLQLQVNELLAETRRDYSKLKAVELLINQLRKLLMKLPDSEVRPSVLGCDSQQQALCAQRELCAVLVVLAV